MTKDDLIRKFQTTEQLSALKRNYQNIVSRFHENGYFPESFTGAYGGMFPRTVGALGQLLIRTGELTLLEKSIGFCQHAMEQYHLEHVPHVIGVDDRGELSSVNTRCQIDGQAHVILAWALLALARDVEDFENESYPFFAKMMDRSTTGEFLTEKRKSRITTGLVLNTDLEHSREWSSWCAYDFLSNAFVAAALEKMVKVAERRQDLDSATKWEARLQALTENIENGLAMEINGIRCYCEMLLPTGRKPVPFSGLSWLNLAVISSGWQGFDEKLFTGTIDQYHRGTTIEWEGPSICACEWNFGDEIGQSVNWSGPAHLACEWDAKGHNNQTYGKMLGWDLLYCVRYEQYQRAYDILDFLDKVNVEDLYAEIFTYKPSKKEWILRDAGNGEQITWLCWSIIQARVELGLAPLR